MFGGKIGKVDHYGIRLSEQKLDRRLPNGIRALKSQPSKAECRIRFRSQSGRSFFYVGKTVYQRLIDIPCFNRILQFLGLGDGIRALQLHNIADLQPRSDQFGEVAVRRAAEHA